MKAITLLLVFVFAIFSSCEKEEDLYAVNPSLTLIGHWEWQSSCGGIAGICNTPASLGYGGTIEFSTDSIVSVYFNDSLALQSRFHIEQALSTITGDSAALLVYEGLSFRKFFTLQTDGTLVITDECADCFSSEYKRLRD